MSGSVDPSERPHREVLAEAANAAGYAPSVHNTQPWRWYVSEHSLDLHADRARQLRVTDPDGRLLHLSCGAALHHARVALAAEGWQAIVVRLPDDANHDHLARVRLDTFVGVSPAAMRLYQAALVRHTDRRPVADVPVPQEVLVTVAASMSTEDTHLHLLHADQVVELAVAANAAQRMEAADPAWRQEIMYWAGGSRAGGTGVPDYVIPAEQPQTTVPARDFGEPGTLPVSVEHDRQAVYGILYSERDDALGWLRGGEALSLAWLTATELGLSVLPLSGATEVAATRRVLARLVADLGHPLLVLRFGVADPDRPGPAHTPRMPTSQIVEIAAEPGHRADSAGSRPADDPTRPR
jgi:nitroreductase